MDGVAPNNLALIFPPIVLPKVQLISGLLLKLILFPTKQVNVSSFHFNPSIETTLDKVVPG